MADTFSDYIVFVDESGDHGLESIDSNYPIFVLAFCVFKKTHYLHELIPAFHEFKMHHFGHDNVILHEREIRKDIGPFVSLKSPQSKQSFLDELTQIIATTQFTLIACVIKKEALIIRYEKPKNPYHVALGFGMERIQSVLRAQGVKNGITHVIVEARGKREDETLELEFRRVCDGDQLIRKLSLPFAIEFVDKKSNSAGLQLADLVARPIGMSVLRPAQFNRAFETIKSKFLCGHDGNYLKRGLKMFP